MLIEKSQPPFTSHTMSRHFDQHSNHMHTHTHTDTYIYMEYEHKHEHRLHIYIPIAFIYSLLFIYLFFLELKHLRNTFLPPVNNLHTLSHSHLFWFSLVYTFSVFSDLNSATCIIFIMKAHCLFKKYHGNNNNKNKIK